MSEFEQHGSGGWGRATARPQDFAHVATPAKRIQRDITPPEIDYDSLLESVHFSFAIERREFVQLLGAGLVVSVVVGPALGQRRGGRGRGGFRGGPPPALSARIHIGEDGCITVLCGKVECGQGARTQIAMAAAEELHVPIGQLKVLLADTGATPDDGMTAGSGTTPRTIPSIRQAAAAVRKLLIDFQTDHPTATYADLVRDPTVKARLASQAPQDVTLTPMEDWRVLGRPHQAISGREIVTGKHQFPSDCKQSGMLYGAILRSPTYRGKLKSVDVEVARSAPGVVVVKDGDFVGVAAPTSYAARQAIEALAKTATWEESPIPASNSTAAYLREHAAGLRESPFADEIKSAAKSLAQSYSIAYVQHAPLEPRTALADWTDGKLTVWTGTQGPFRVKGELQGAFRLADDAVRVVVPDFGSGYGGKHTGEVSVEAARLAKAAGKPVMLRWTREEEFTWAYFRPAGVMELEASLDAENHIATWRHININSGGSSLESPYKAAKKDEQSLRSRPPLREGSYRALAATGNSFARECFIDELAALAGVEPLEFRMANLDEPRLRPVLGAVAKSFNWRERHSNKQPDRGVGLACSWDKGSVVACAVEVEVDPETRDIRVVEVCEAFECGKVINPDNLRSQIEGAIVMGMGPALSEAMRFDDKRITNASFRTYRVPHFRDVPKIEAILVDRPDLTSVGAGETPLIVVAPAIANAVFHATGPRLRSMPLKLT
jgi:CO/xanthine dehydrogenase Mo-binding subunit